MANRGDKNKKKDDKNKNKGMTEYILENPIPCGYLLQFCDVEHNAENLRFAMDVEKFKEKNHDPAVWTKTWIVLDNERGIKNLRNDMKVVDASGDQISDGSEASNWPSSSVIRGEMMRDIQVIVDTFISNDSPTQICLSKECLKRTECRVSNLHIYGTEVFGEALVDPIKTINKDIMPRFQKSPMYAKMNSRMAHVDPLPLASTLEVDSPDESYIMDQEWMDVVDSHTFVLDDMLKDMYLYQCFLEYLEENNCPEHLLCIRMIQIFEDRLLEKDREGANDQAWEIYKYFIAVGCAYEVGCSSQTRKEIMLNLCKSRSGDFEAVRKASYAQLVPQFSNFQSSPTYGELPGFMKKTKKMMDRKAARAKGVFGLFSKK